MGRFLALEPGDLLELGRHAGQELEILAGDRPIAMGRAVRVGDRFGVRITRTIDAAPRTRATADCGD